MEGQKRFKSIDGLIRKRKVKPANFVVSQKSLSQPMPKFLPPAPPVPKKSIFVKPTKLSLPPSAEIVSAPKEQRIFPDLGFFEIPLAQEYEKDARERGGLIKRILFVSSALIIFLFLAISGVFLFQNSRSISEKVFAASLTGKTNLLAAQDSLLSFDFEGANTDFEKAYADFEKIDKELASLGQANVLIGKMSDDSVIFSGEKLVSVAKNISSAGEDLSSCAALFNDFSILNQQKIDSWYAFEGAKKRLSDADKKLERAQEDLAYINLKTLPEVKGLIDDIKNKLPEFRKLLTLLTNFVYEAPKLLGKDKSQKYLILFQNPAEARATGGFLGNYGYLEFDQGKMIGPKVSDIYKLQWLTRGKNDIIKPPEEIYQAHIGLWQKSRWEIWDANWAIDFPETAKKMEWYYEQYDQGLTEGVFACDPIVFSDILKIIGPVKMKKYGVIINDQNFWRVMERKVELDNPFKKGKASYGQANPKQILKDFSILFMQKIKTENKEKKIEIIKSLYQNLKRKHLLLFANSPALADILANLNWNGQIVSTPGDYLAVNESNVGVNKSSSRIKQSFDLNVDISTDKIQNRLTIIRKHLGKKNNPIEGRNISYLRILVPKGSTLNSILIDGEDVAPKVILGEEGGKTKFGILTKLRPQATQIIEVVYTLPFILEPTSITPKYYSLYFQKQPGKIADPVTLKVNVDPVFKIKAIESNGNSNFSKNIVELSSEHWEDREFRILLGK